MTITVESIIRQWAGGEHRLAGERASELVYEESAVLNGALLSQIRDGAPDIDAYLVAPVAAVAIAEVLGGLPEELPLDPDGNPASDLAPPVAPEEPPADLPPASTEETPTEPAPAA